MGRTGSRRAVDPALLAVCGLILLLLAAPGAGAADSLRILSQNMNRLFDDVDNGNREKRLTRKRFRERVSMAATRFGQDYGLPHIIALQEIENRNVLAQIAAEIERRHGTRYRVLTLPGNDVSGINLGFLVREDLTVRKLEQLFEGHRINDGEFLFSRPPLYLDACYVGKCLILVNLHLRSMRGIDHDRRGKRVRQKRLHQAETIAAWSDRLQQSAKPPSLLLLGDFNALTPSDKFVDVAGILRGKPKAAGVRLRGRDLIEPDLIDLTRRIPAAKRFSFIFRGRKQQLDYMLANEAFDAELESISFGKIDFDFSDHAGLLSRFAW